MSHIMNKNGKCVHYWIVEPANGPISRGQCKNCGLAAEFFNDLHKRFDYPVKFTIEKNTKTAKVTK